jgi:hypothetical protein
MSRGFITVAQNSAFGDYVRAAYGLALSLKRTQSKYAGLTVLVTPGTVIPDRYRGVFDKVIEIPWGDDAISEEWKIHNKWKVYFATPYEETILLDADMLIGVDLDAYWNILRHRPVFACTSPYTFRGDPIVKTPFRNAFDMHDLPHVYTAFFYFRRGDQSQRYFRKVQQVYENWAGLRSHFYHLPEKVSGDLAFALAMRLTETERLYCSKEFPGIVHMKTEIQDLGQGRLLEDWTHHLGSQVREDGSIYVGGYHQRLPFHYQVKTFLTDSILERLERGQS